MSTASIYGLVWSLLGYALIATGRTTFGFGAFAVGLFSIVIQIVSS